MQKFPVGSIWCWKETWIQLGGCVWGRPVSPGHLSTLLTSRMKNFAVFTLAQVFFSLETGLMFMPAERGRAELGRAAPGCTAPLTSSGRRPLCDPRWPSPSGSTLTTAEVCSSHSCQVAGRCHTGAGLASTSAGHQSQCSAHWTHTMTSACLGPPLSLYLGTHAKPSLSTLRGLSSPPPDLWGSHGPSWHQALLGGAPWLTPMCPGARPGPATHRQWP